MAINIQMPALSPTMEEGTLAKWLVKEGDTVKSGDLLAEIETDKATMEFEAVDEGIIGKIVIPEGTDNVKVGEVIAVLIEEGESVPAAGASAAAPKAEAAPAPRPEPEVTKAAAATPAPVVASAAPAAAGDRVKASPLARRIAAQAGVELGAVTGTGPGGRIVKADIEGFKPGSVMAEKAPAAAPAAAPAPTAAPAPAPVHAQDFGIPHEVEKLSNMRKTIARRLTESKQQVPHIYLTVDIRLDALLKLRGELNAALSSTGVKLSVNDMLIKALAKALIACPKVNVQFAGDQLLKFKRADVSVAVSIPAGLITPIITDAGSKSISAISTVMKDLAARAKDGKLKPEEFTGGTASLSNMGMMGIKQFEAVINPPQAMIMAIGAGEQRPYVIDGALGIATVMSATGSFDHRAVDGADGAELMKVFKELVEAPLGLVA
ncbi:MAG: pyruvate dehydrogenase complex dihydrolipoamide acetyltransferase [Sphingomonas sp.]|nr:pyruvate dehydrogenase complex dihydrolipoamide acetyltransferase [Sphingomonas sp.]